ncbi:MAG: nucleotidyl transferase AbiEii/AbiGii toxin family protein [Candidatus Eremiobacterota bacterium]
MTNPRPTRPAGLSPLAECCIRALADQGLGRALSVGGAVGLMHYHEYRPTSDLDAWWDEDADEGQRKRVLQTARGALESAGTVSVRQWGEVASVELSQEGRKVFSFQVASRSARLREPVQLPWAAVQLDSLEDLIASKMVALVERGAPRDFRDIYELCREALTDAPRAWHLWAERQRLSGSDPDHGRAALALETHLSRLERHRPLAEIADPREKQRAGALRQWFREEFTHAGR